LVVPDGSSESIQEVPVLASWEGKFHASFDRNTALDISNESIKDFIPPERFSTAFLLNLRLMHPDLLYSSYKRRLWYTAALIMAAATAAWIGIINAWKGYRRQLKLAEMTSNFVSSVSHELRTPLASMRLMAESLDRGMSANEQKRKEYYGLIVQECRRLSSLVENVLDFSRIRQGRKHYEFESIDCTALVRETVRMMEPMAKERNLTFSVQTGAELDLQPEWDGPAVQQAVINLLDNAMKHSPESSIIEVELKMTGDRKIQIAIRDQGPGISEEEQKRIFDAFYRLGSELRRETWGIGIGLGIVKHVAEAHGGKVFLESTPGQGSRFILELPLIPPAARQL
jgi:two-component system phosphate regulon sensor histidine kinase PhoR